MKKTLLVQGRKNIYELQKDNGGIEYFAVIGVLRWDINKEIFMQNVVFHTTSAKEIYNYLWGKK